MDLMAMMGMGGASKTWAPHTDSDAYELVTPALQAQQSDVLRFYADISSGYLNVEYRRSTDAAWTYDNTYIVADSLFFIAPYTGIYQFRFTGSSVSVDDFIGFRLPAPDVALYEGRDDDNAKVFEENKGKRVNVTYDRVLSAQSQGYGSWTPMAYTICLPYEFRVSSLVAPGTVKLYQLSYIDQYYRQFIFTDVADVAEAGLPYLAVVERDNVSLNAYNVEMLAEPADGTDARTAVYDYEDMYFNELQTKVGEWLGTFRSIPSTEADNQQMYCVREDGTWACFQSGSEETPSNLDAFRGYFLVTASETGARSQAPRVPGEDVFKTIFQPSNSTSVDALESVVFHGDIPMTTTTGIESYSIQTIDADGATRYFDLQGRLLNDKPVKGLYIKDNKKVFDR